MLNTVEGLDNAKKTNAKGLPCCVILLMIQLFLFDFFNDCITKMLCHFKAVPYILLPFARSITL